MRPRINLLGAQLAAGLVTPITCSPSEEERLKTLERMQRSLELEAAKEAYARKHGPYALGFEIADKDPNVLKLEIPWRYKEDRMVFTCDDEVTRAPNCSYKNVSPYRVGKRRQKNKAARGARRRNRKHK